MKKQLLVSSLLLLPLYSFADAWSGQASVGFSQGSYSGNTAKSGSSGYDLGLGLSYFDSFDVGAKLSKLELDFDSLNTTESQNETTLYANKHIFVDSLSGKVSLGGSFQNISGNASDLALGDGTVSGVALRYLHFSKKFYADIHSSTSDYDKGTEAKQLDFSIGLQLFSPSWWLHARHYNIDFDRPITAYETTTVTQNPPPAGAPPGAPLPPPTFSTSTTTLVAEKRDYQATDITLKHWLGTEKILGIDSIQLGFLSGDRRLAHDPDSLNTWSLSDVQTSYSRIGLNWELKNGGSIDLLAGESEYQDSTSLQQHTNKIFHLSFSKNW